MFLLSVSSTGIKVVRDLLRVCVCAEVFQFSNTCSSLLSVCACVCVCVHMFVCVCAHVYVHVCVCVHLPVYILNIVMFEPVSMCALSVSCLLS